jgi:mono/diheme cytochrome c family protein
MIRRLLPLGVLGLALGSALALGSTPGSTLGSALALGSTPGSTLGSTPALGSARGSGSPQGGAAGRRPGLANAPGPAAALPNPYAGRPEAVLAGRKLFLRYCAECHGADARGGRRAPSLDTDRVREAPPGGLFWFLTNGNLRKAMPPWSRLPEAQRWQLAAYLKTLGRPPAP